MTSYDFLITSYNGEKRIGATLESLWEQIKASQIDKSGVRIILANNASTDNTKAVAEKYLDEMPLEIIDVPTPGKSKALNYAIENSIKADVIFMTDDDTTFANNWLDNYLAALEANPEFDVFAGRIVPNWEKDMDPDLESWIPMGSTYAIHERDESGACDPGLVWGPNKAVRRKVFDAGLRYDERIGPTPEKFYAMGEDTTFAVTADKAGFKTYFVADAIVEHLIKANTISEDWVIRRAERLGYGIFVLRSVDEHDWKFPSFIPHSIELFFQFIFWGYIIYPITFLLPKSKQRFWLRWRKYYYKGLWKSYRDFVKN